jgi:hypothetical protein
MFLLSLYHCTSPSLHQMAVGHYCLFHRCSKSPTSVHVMLLIQVPDINSSDVIHKDEGISVICHEAVALVRFEKSLNIGQSSA